MTKENLSKTVASGILTTIFGGLFIYLFSFFSSIFPATQGKIQLLESKIKTHDKYLERIDNKTDRILDHLMKKKE